MGVGGAGLATEGTEVTVVEKRLPEVRDGRGTADGITDSAAAASDNVAGIVANSEASSLPSPARAFDDAPTALTLFNREGIRSVGLVSVASVPESRRGPGCWAVGDSSTEKSTALEKGFPNVAGFKMLWFWEFPDDVKEFPVPMRDGRSSGLEEPLHSEASKNQKYVSQFSV